MIEKISETPKKLAGRIREYFTAPQAEIDAERMLTDRRLVMESLIALGLRVENITSVYLNDNEKCILKTNIRLPDFRFREEELSGLKTWHDWLDRDAQLERVIAALGFVQVLTADSKILGINPRRFEILPEDVNNVCGTLYDKETHFPLKMRTSMKYLKDKFEIACREIPLIDRAEQLARNVRGVMSTASTPETHLR